MSSSQRDGGPASCEEFALPYELSASLSRPLPATGKQASSHLNDLASTIEGAIIPRLLINHGVRPAPMGEATVYVKQPILPVEEFTRLILSENSRDSQDYIDTLVARGTSVESLLLDLMAPAARLMGEMWTADLCHFVDVTLGLSRLQQLLRRLNTQSSRADGLRTAAMPQALLLPAPGEQHMFGLRILEEFLLRDGWDVRCNLRINESDIIDLVSEDDYVFAGFSLSHEDLLKPLASAIQMVRDTSRNRDIKVMVGGVIFVDHPELVSNVGADALGRDAKEAVFLAKQWIEPVRLS